MEGLFYNNIISEMRSDSLSSLQFSSFNVGDFTPNIIVRILSIFFVLIKYSLSLKYFLLNMPSRYNLPRKLVDKTLQMQYDIDI